MAENTLFNEQEFNDLKALAETIKDYLPTDKVNLVWNAYKKISGNVNEPQPCTCPSSGNLWAKAVNAIREYVNSVNNDGSNG